MKVWEQLLRARAIVSFIIQYYEANPEIPKEIALQTEPESKDVLVELLSKKRGNKVTMVVPKRGIKAELINMAVQNAKEELELYQRNVLAAQAKSFEAVKKLQNTLKLQNMPRRIEAYDVSNTGSTEIVASMVVFRDGQADSQSWRFKMKVITEQNDYGSMRRP